MKTPIDLINYAIKNMPEETEILPVGSIVMDAARQNDKRPAYIKIAVPDRMAQNLKGDSEKRDLLLLFKIPRAAVDEIESPIVRPDRVTP